MDVLVMYEPSAGVPMMIRPEHIAQMQACVDGRVFYCANEKEALERGLDAEVLFFWGGSGIMPVSYCTGSKKLKWLHSFSAGLNPVMESPITELDVKLTNAKGIHGRTMALTTMGYIISFLRNFPELQRRQQRREWNKTVAVPYRDTEGLTLAVIGAGAIGGDVARLSKALGMRTIGVKRNVCPLPDFDEVLPSAALHAALSEADFVVVVTPLTDDTRGMIGKEELAAMKDSGILINIGRGPVVDTAALIEALESRAIAGAALDAVDPEPLPASSPLWGMDNVIITPHCSADSTLYIDRAVSQFCGNLKRYQAGEPLMNEIQLSNRY